MFYGVNLYLYNRYIHTCYSVSTNYNFFLVKVNVAGSQYKLLHVVFFDLILPATANLTTES